MHGHMNLDLAFQLKDLWIG